MQFVYIYLRSATQHSHQAFAVLRAHVAVFQRDARVHGTDKGFTVEVYKGFTVQGDCSWQHISRQLHIKPQTKQTTAHHLPCGVNFADCVFSIAATLLGEECDILEAEAGRRDGDTSDICCARRVSRTCF